MTADYRDTLLFINGQWRPAAGNASLAVINPATGGELGRVASASRMDLDEALAAVDAGFLVWRNVPVFERSKLMRKAANILRERVGDTARLLTLEQGKPLAEARLEVLAAADIIDWFAEESRRSYGRIIPSRNPAVQQQVIKEPVGPVAGFTPWNVPLNQATRKISAALAAGCSIILKGAEETPACIAALVQAYADAGLPPGVVNLVFGVPADISSYLIAHPIIRKVTFTGSTPVGKQLAAMAGQHMKRVTMELGGHAPAMVFADADIALAVKLLAAAKYRNAGQICVSPTRILIQEAVADEFIESFLRAVDNVKVGDGLADDTTMGPLANPRRVEAMQRLVQDAVEKGAVLRTGGKRIGDIGNFYSPTVLTNVPLTAAVMNEEPFGPLAIINTFTDIDDVVKEANRLPYGLAAYAYTRSEKTARTLSASVHTGMLSINHHGLGLPETPFGGVQDSGYGSEGGSEALEAYFNIKFVTHAV